MRMSLRTASFARAGRAPPHPRAALLRASLLAALPATAAGGDPDRRARPEEGRQVRHLRRPDRQKGKLVPLKHSLYRYRYVRIKRGRNRGKFRRTIIQATVQVKTSCITQCVQLRKKGDALQPAFRMRRVWVREPSRGRLVKVKRLRRVWLLGPCASLPSIEALGTPVIVSVLDKSSLTFDFSAFKREAPVTGQLRGYVPGKLLEDADNQVILTSGRFDLGRTTMFSDKVCGGQPRTRSAPPTRRA